jgi:hypothetical protein
VHMQAIGKPGKETDMQAVALRVAKARALRRKSELRDATECDSQPTTTDKESNQ